MDQTFLININCSRILFDCQETQYTMFIDTDKISIVYELIEWIRWIFSVETCIYITHENSVIHELEDIRVLAKMKNFEIKPCGRPGCVHKKAYRNLLNNLNMFVSWNETKVHKYFLEKLSQMDEKLIQKDMKHERLKNKFPLKKNKEIIPEKSCENEYSVSSLNHGQLHLEQGFIDDSTPESATKDSSFNKKHENSLFLSEYNSESSELSNLSSRQISANHKNSVNLSRTDSFIKNQSNIKDTDCIKSKMRKSSHKFVRPFSLGQLLTSMKENLEKESLQTRVSKNTSTHGFFGQKNSENLILNEASSGGGKKRQRTRRRKKSKKENLETKQISSPVLESYGFAENIYNFNSSSYTKPNHIRFDEDENKLMETDSVEGDLKFKNNSEIEIDLKSSDLVEAEPLKLTEDNCQDYLNSCVTSPAKGKIENSVVEDEIINLGEQVFDNGHQLCSITGSLETDIFNKDLSMLQSLKDKFKNAVVVKRFY